MQRLAPALALLASTLATGSRSHPPPPLVLANPNTARAGVLRAGVLTVALDAKQVLWQLNGPNRRPMTIGAFAEPGRQPLMPGPLIRASEGTELHLSVHNSLAVPLTMYLPAGVHAPGDPGMDSLVIEPGAFGQMTTSLAVPGNYAYRAATATGASKIMPYAGLLTGALVIDSAGAPTRPRDRVFVIMQTGDSAWVSFADTAAPNLAAASPARVGRFLYTINGRAWPATERIHAVVGDSLHWRIINASYEPHPMHLHGFYYRVDDYAGPQLARFGQPAPGQMVVTQLMSPFSTMSITWSPTRAGNWLFHCHFALHNMPDSLSAAPDDPDMRGMTGLVLGVEVANRPGVVMAGKPTTPARHLRLVAEGGAANPGTVDPDSVPSMRFVLYDGDHVNEGGHDFSPELDLLRGEPVAITIVNHLREPTSIHWHGIEVQDSYADGVPRFSGSGTHLTPAIAPGDSFVARFTPPRAGTFMYHAHVDDLMQQAAGMEGALIVRDAGASPLADHVFFLKGRGASRRHPLEINGRADPDTVVLHVGQSARLRLINLSTVNIAPSVSLTASATSPETIGRDTMVVEWKPLAKDGFDLPAERRIPTRARTIIAVGETYDFEYTPETHGKLQLEFRNSGTAHRLLIRVPIKVE